MNLSQTLLGLPFQNPTVLASGIWGITAGSWRRAAKGGAGAITTKSLWLKEHKGHPNPTIVSTPHYSLNAVGVPDAGVEKAREEIGEFLKTHEVPLIANIIAESVGKYAETAEAIAALQPDMIEVNISCPNVEDEFGKPFACSAANAAAVTKAVKEVTGKIPVFVKLSPNVDDIGDIAKAVVKTGADGLTVINTMGPGMAIDLKTRMPILSNKVGGVSGRAIKPIAIRCVWDCFRATEGSVPIIGTGGVTTGEDAIELMIAGASLIGIGTALWERGENVFRTVCNEIEAWCSANGIKNLTEIIGSMTT